MFDWFLSLKAGDYLQGNIIQSALLFAVCSPVLKCIFPCVGVCVCVSICRELPCFANGLNVTCIFKLIFFTHACAYNVCCAYFVTNNLKFVAIVVKFTFYMILINQVPRNIVIVAVVKLLKNRNSFFFFFYFVLLSAVLAAHTRFARKINVCDFSQCVCVFMCSCKDVFVLDYNFPCLLRLSVGQRWQ